MTSYYYVTSTGSVHRYDVPEDEDHWRWMEVIGLGMYPGAIAYGFKTREEARSWYWGD